MRRSAFRFEELITLDDAAAYGSEGEKIGTVSDVYCDLEANQPLWAALEIAFGKKRVLVPLEGASPFNDGIKLRFTRDEVVESPYMEDEGDGYLDRDFEVAIYLYYGLFHPDSEGSIFEQRPPGKGNLHKCRLH